ncbi:protein O-linked-mannose beta-1,2-N-acetylglucosaminyltransferase 1 [Procambarus clarkii]|uniref:protein O-linked-mannose beta-1,2-N-acetylglucosaminyltransferase 1 n=1 Tax=Procambarus clarkii TaxID=6728 RepID=UPI003742AD07
MALPVLLLVVCAGWWPEGVGGSLIRVNLTIALSDTTNVTKTVDIDERSLKSFNVTLEEFSNSLVRTDAFGKVKETVVGGRHIPLELAMNNDMDSVVYTFGTVDGGSWSVSNNNFTNITIEDFRDDETLRPVEVTLEWSLPLPALPRPVNVTMRSATLEATIHLHNSTLVSQKVDGHLEKSNWVLLVPYTGIYLRVVNPYTRLLTLAAYFNTEDYFADLELVDTLRNLQHGRVALISSYYDASGRLEASSKAALTSLGSFAAQHLTFRDCWAWAWLVGGSTLAEGLVTNAHGTTSFPHSLDLQLVLPPPPPSSERLCDSWSELWSKRQHFCDAYDGYGDLCSCCTPFTPSTNTTTGVPREELGVVVVASNRPRYLYRLLRQLLTQVGVVVEQVLVSVDGECVETIKLLEVLGLRWLVHAPEGSLSPRISRHVRFALFHALEEVSADKIIVLEEDLILAPDFFSYMQQTAVLLDRDPSLYAVSAYSHFSYAHTAHDPTRLNRVHSLPAYGWMVKRSFLRETLPKWPPVSVTTDWDYWMGCGLVRRGRELVIPEVSRTTHAGLSGTHFSGQLAKRRFSNKPLSHDPNTLVNLTSVDRKVYERELRDLLVRALPLNITNPYNFTFPVHGGVYAACVKMMSSSDIVAFKVLADALQVWNQDLRDHHYGLWRIPFHRAIILIIGIPYSKYSYGYMKDHCPVLKVKKKHYEHMMENYLDQTYHFLEHGNHDYLNILKFSHDQPYPGLDSQKLSTGLCGAAAAGEATSADNILEDQHTYNNVYVEDPHNYASTPIRDVSNYTSTPAGDESHYTSARAEDRSNYTSTPDDAFNYTSALAEDQSNYTSEPVENASNYTSEPVKDASNYTSEPVEDASNYTSEPVEDASNYTSEPVEDASNYTSASVEDRLIYTSTPVDDRPNISKSHLESCSIISVNQLKTSPIILAHLLETRPVIPDLLLKIFSIIPT